MTFSTEYSPPSYRPKRRKWYFAYHVMHGELFPMAWAEDDGICVGGHPVYANGTKVEITEEQFNIGLYILTQFYPIPLVTNVEDVKRLFRV